MKLTSFTYHGFCFYPLLLVGFLFILNLQQLSAQPFDYSIKITDNAAIYNNKIEYQIINDSLIIIGVGDFGRTPVKYLSRSLTKKEKKSLHKFLNTFPLDSLDDLYRNDFNPVDYDNKSYYPRLMEIHLSRKNQQMWYRTENCWVRYSDLIFNFINPMLPAEVRIQYDKSNFNAFY